MPFRHLIRSSAFRLALLAALLFSLVSAIGLGAVYWSTANHLEHRIDARLETEAARLVRGYRGRPLPELAESIRRSHRDDGAPRLFFYRLTGSGHSQSSASPDPEPGLATLPLSRVIRNAGSDAPVRVLTTVLPDGHRLSVGIDLAEEQTLLRHVTRTAMFLTAVELLLALLVGAWLASRTWRRIEAMRRTAETIMAGDLSRRIALSNRNDEFDALAARLNAMLNRIEELMQAMRQVTDNIAHDLRQPLNRLRNRLEISLLDTRDSAEYRTTITQAITDAEHLLRTFNALLGIARATAGTHSHQWQPLELTRVAADLTDLYAPAAEQRGIALNGPHRQGPAHIRGVRELIAQALGNLLDNAIKYTPAGGRIELRVDSAPNITTLSVADTGPGIPPPDRDRVLKRFERLDNARTTPGSGLGLSLVDAVAKLHHARLELGDNHPGLYVALHFKTFAPAEPPTPDDRWKTIPRRCSGP